MTDDEVKEMRELFEVEAQSDGFLVERQVLAVPALVLVAEVERLRAVLVRIRDESGGGSLPRARKMAREALAESVPA